MNYDSKEYYRNLNAMIKIWIFMERKRQDRHLEMVDLPDWIIKYNGARCDAALGPCSCGAWHTEEELRRF